MTRRYAAAPILIAFALAGCDRPDAGAENVIVEAQQQAKSAPRSIMRPAVATPEPAPTPPAPTKLTIPFGDAHGGALDEAQTALLDPLAARLAGTADTIVLRGSTDSHGSDRRNRLVSRRRARLVALYLAGKGIAADRMELVALGEDRPIAPNAKPDGSDDPEGRACNRRVEIEIVPGRGAATSPAPDAPTPQAAPATN